MIYLFGALVVLFVIVCVLLCLVVLIQSDKGGGISGALGGGLSGANALLGTQNTADILTRATSWLAAAYMILCVVISLFVARGAAGGSVKSVLKQRAEKYDSPASILQGGGIKLEEDAGAAGAEGASGGLQLGAEVPEQPADAGQDDE
jgi:preprotein translocase subunit SecG